jgi:hypothetical protein
MSDDQFNKIFGKLADHDQRFDKMDQQFAMLLRWFETLSGRFDRLEATMTAGFAAIHDDIHEMRELMGQMQDDDRVQRRAIADLDRRVETLEHAR